MNRFLIAVLGTTPKRIGLGVVTAIGGVAMLDRIEVPHPSVYSPETSAEKILSVPDGRRWRVTHDYGALTAQSTGIESWRARADALPEGLAHAYYDGASHHFAFDSNNIPGTVKSIKQNIPDFYQSVFFDGMMRTYTKEHADNPDAVLAWAERLRELTATTGLVNGIRNGIQQAYGSDMPLAIEVARTYPSDMHSAIYEELGWRAGDEHDLSTTFWQRLSDGIPSTARCSFAEGMVKGRLLRLLEDEHPWPDAVNAFHTAMPADCHSQIESGIAEALLIAVGDRPELREAESDRLNEGPLQASVNAIMDQRLKSTDGADENAPPPPEAVPAP